MQRIYFDGTFESAGQVLTACKQINKRVFVVMHRNATDQEREFVWRLQDSSGSLGHFENGRFVGHTSRGSGRHCTRSVQDGIEAYFDILAERDDLNEDEKLEEIKFLRACDADTCRSCIVCRHVERVAEDYGFYDVLEILKE